MSGVAVVCGCMVACGTSVGIGVAVGLGVVFAPLLPEDGFFVAEGLLSLPLEPLSSLP